MGTEHRLGITSMGTDNTNVGELWDCLDCGCLILKKDGDYCGRCRDDKEPHDFISDDNRLMVRLLEPHADDCYAVKQVREGAWSTPWTFAYKEEHHAPPSSELPDPDVIGPYDNFFKLQCNDTNCEAVIFVNYDHFLNQLPAYDPQVDDEGYK